MNGMLDTCIACGRQATKPGAGICRLCEIAALIDLSFDRMRAAIRGDIPVIGRRLSVTPKSAPGARVRDFIE